jgi:hypothetical protein
MIFKACSVSKELENKAMVHLASSTVTKKKFRNIVPTPSGTG